MGGKAMTLSLPVVWAPDSLLHAPLAEIWVGVRTPGTEVLDRVSVIKEALDSTGASVQPAKPHGDEILQRVHSPELLEYLSGAWDTWVAAGFLKEPGQDRVVPYVFPTPDLLEGLPLRSPTAVHARAGRYCYDTMTLVGPGTWAAARASIDATLTAVDLVESGVPVAYALTRPPGHHATRSAFGGSCYLNNAAVAAEALRSGGAERVAIVDIDAHHGNGTQALFYERGDVFYGSLHVDPGAGWFPHFVGFADESGAGEGKGRNLNLPLSPGTSDEAWLGALQEIRDAIAGYDACVISLGVDAAGEDPESPLQVTEEGFHKAGRMLAGLGPTVVVQEGGYNLDTLGQLVVAFLSGMEGNRAY
jgi:acetoin utilization deacetylase AcuC-like enzyme